MAFTIMISLLALISGIAAFTIWKECIWSVRWETKGVTIFEGAVGLFFSLLALFSAFCVVYYNAGHYKTTVVDTQVVVEKGENGGFEKLYVFVDKGDGYAKRYEFIGRNKYNAPQPGDKIDMTYREFYKRYESLENDSYYKVSELSREPS